jgi:hypothetical protein
MLMQLLRLPSAPQRVRHRYSPQRCNRVALLWYCTTITNRYDICATSNWLLVRLERAPLGCCLGQMCVKCWPEVRASALISRRPARLQEELVAHRGFWQQTCTRVAEAAGVGGVCWHDALMALGLALCDKRLMR